MAAEPAQREERPRWWEGSLFRWLLFLELMALFAMLYCNLGGQLISQTNRTDKDIHGADQLHNMRQAAQTRPDLHPDFRNGFLRPLADFFPHRTDGVVQPLWPWVAAWLAHDGQEFTDADMAAEAPVSDAGRALFDRGRWFNVFMTLAFLAILGIASCRIFSLPAACNLVLLGGLGALLPRAAFFQPEPLYYVLFFLTWVACVSALRHNSLWIYGLIGVLAGLAYMTKGSITPLLAVFVAVSSLRCVWEMIATRRQDPHISSPSLWHWRNHLMGVIVLGAAYIFTIGPRLKEAQANFGDPFHSYPAYWMWLDSFGGPNTVQDPKTCYGWMDKHNSLRELQEMTPSERPSFSNYLRTHSPAEFLGRLWDGTKSRLGEFVWPRQTKVINNLDKWSGWRGILEWRGLYLGWLALILFALAFALVAAAPKAEHAGHFVFRLDTWTILLFVSGSSAAYALAYGFYAPIARGSGDRFMLSLYLPLAFSMIWGAESIVRRIRLRQGSPWFRRAYLLAHWGLFAVLCWRVVEIIRLPKFYPG